MISKSIVNLPKEAVFSINTESDIANVSSAFLRGDFSIIQYGGGFVHITPSKGIEAVNRETMIVRLQKERTKGYQLTFYDRARGYGQHFIQVKAFNFINLGCCEDRYAQNPSGDWSQAGHTREIVKRFTDTGDRVRRDQLVSNCGDVSYPRY